MVERVGRDETTFSSTFFMKSLTKVTFEGSPQCNRVSEAARAPYFSGIDLPGCAPPLHNCFSAVRTRRYRSAFVTLRLPALAEPAACGRKRQLGQIGRSFHMELFHGMAMGMAVPLPESGVCHAQLLPHHPAHACYLRRNFTRPRARLHTRLFLVRMH